MNKALLVGINTYTKYPDSTLDGCVNDVSGMANFLVAKCGFQQDDVRMLVDERATKSAILDRLSWLFTGIRAGDRILLHNSGHGVELATRNAQGEVDSVSDAICCTDFSWLNLDSATNTISDIEFLKIFSSVPTGVEFIWIADTCFSGGLLGMRDMIFRRNKVKTIAPPADIAWRIKTAKAKGLKAIGFVKAAQDCNVALISGCKADQKSSEDYFDEDGNSAAPPAGKPNGVLTYFLLRELSTENGLTEPITSLVETISSNISNTRLYDQDPQLEGNDDIKNGTFLSA